MIRNDCDGPSQIGPIEGTVYRLVESEKDIATLAYVDTLEEQALLEEMLEDSKRRYPAASDAYDYLLKTPFRYPPLKWGSRFGRPHEPSLFYGARRIDTTLAEAAYYRLVFWHAMTTPPPAKAIRTRHTSFAVGYRTRHGVQLHTDVFAGHQAALTHPFDYAACQALGTAMREAGIEAFEYTSARDPRRGRCVGLFVLSAFSAKVPQDKSAWVCELSATRVAFKREREKAIVHFEKSDFEVDGALPMPA